jgi:hypothetical protein
VHRALVRCYGTGEGYPAAQASVNGYRNESWFEKFRTNGEWNERIGAGGRLTSSLTYQTETTQSACEMELVYADEHPAHPAA